jgi:predicted dehydrogenase
MTKRRNRRQFLRHSAVAGIGFWVAGGLSRGDTKSPLEKVNFACIGIDGKGGSDTDQAGNHGNIVALCDIDDNYLAKKAEKYPKAKKYNDFRKMLDEIGKDIDAVTVSTPDHTHAPASIMAMKMKKHVYCQKPLTHTVKEARLMREVAKECGVCTQMGNQGSASDGLRDGVELVQAGIIGDVTEAHVWTNRPIWPQAPKVMKRPAPAEPPRHVHWDEWLGPAPERPYAPGYHPFAWRGWWDFGTGALGDMACHTANLAFRALELGHPTSVIAECGDLNPETYPRWATVVLQFPARGSKPPVKFFWYEGQFLGTKNLPPRDLFHGNDPPGSGSLLVGTKGILYSPDDYGERFILLPRKEFEGYQKPPKRLPRNGGGDDGMKAEWVEAIKANKPSIAYSNFDFAGMMTEAILLGNIAIRLPGRKLDWDGPGLKFTNVPEANQYVHFEYRKGWTL